MEAEEDDVHAGQDEVVEGDVHGCLTAPVSRRYETRDPQRGATLDLRRKKYKSTLDGDREECWTKYFMSQTSDLDEFGADYADLFLLLGCFYFSNTGRGR